MEQFIHGYIQGTPQANVLELSTMELEAAAVELTLGH